MALSTLLVDDDRAFSAVAVAALQREGFPVTAVHSLHAGRQAVDKGSFELVVLDRRLPDGDGMAWLPELKATLPGAVVVMVTAHGDIASAVEAIRLGAADYLAKPIELSDLVMKARRASEDLRIRDRLERAEGELSGRRRLVPPKSKAMQQIIGTLERIASSPRSSVVLLGETGVGKEVLAWHVHKSGAGESAPFVHVNCAALPDSTAESELFGHEKGSFTDAKATRRGLVELANGGTLFLDEVGELSASIQAKLLTFLDSGHFRRLGGAAEQSSSARVVAATNRDLQAGIRDGKFREDLWFRLSVFKVEVPPLRERTEDLEGLAAGLLRSIGAEMRRRDLSLSPAALARLKAYRFPGNVRELKNILERAIVLEEGPVLELSQITLGEAQLAAISPDTFVVRGDPVTAEELEKRYVKWLLERMGGKRMETAKLLGLSYPTFLKRLGEDQS
jgi:DNA-binding NtrC family response regulator